MYIETITVTKKNEAYLHVDCEPSIAMELSEYFCFFAVGYKFMPSYKNKMWDGKIRLFNTRERKLYCGLFKYLEEFAETRGYQLVNDGATVHKEPNLEALLEMCTLTGGGNPITPRGYQLEAIHKALSDTKALLLSPTASGKSLIIYLTMRYFLADNPKKKVLLIVPTTSLVEQMYSDFADYSQNDQWNVETNCHKIYSGKEKHDISQRVIITTWQSIFKLPAAWFTEYGMVIGDEAHTFKAKSLTSIMDKCVNAEYRVGTTGTLDGTQTHQMVLEGVFGPVYKVTTTKALMDDGSLSKMDIDILLLKYQDEFCKLVSKYKYQDEVDWIVTNEKRNAFIKNLALDQKGNTLVLFQFVAKHGKPLFKMIQEGAEKDRKVFYVSGETDVDTREQVREITEKESNAIIVASLGTFSTGINIKRLHNIIFASPSKAQIKILQSIGRGLRKSNDGIDTKVYDIADDLHWKSNKNYTLNHAAERIKIYTKEHFDYKIYEVKI